MNSRNTILEFFNSFLEKHNKKGLIAPGHEVLLHQIYIYLYNGRKMIKMDEKWKKK